MRPVLLALLLAAPAALAQSLASLAPIPFDTSGPVLRADTQAQKPFTVAGEHGVLLGQQNGALEAWVLPVKLFSHLTLQADMADYPVPIDVNQHAASIEVRPDRTIITYSHIGFTVRQIMFSPTDSSLAGVGPVILYQFDCLRPTDFTFRFTPELQWMWPQRNEGVPGVEWEPHPFHPRTPVTAPSTNGLYILHTDYPDLAEAITIPGAEPGILTPYQERPQVHPVELHLHIDPARDNGRLFPLLMAIGTDPASASNAALARTLAQLNAALPSLYAVHAQRFKDLLAHSASISTPDKSLDEAFQWAVVSIEQLKTSVYQPENLCPDQQPCHPEGSALGAPSMTRVNDGVSGAEGPAFRDSSLPTTSDETALVAGYFTSADSARPGFGWFFGRDALYTLYAVNGYGDFALTRSELNFLKARQRADGKIMHEYSQTAAALDWRAFPYMYAAADSTPLFILAMADYLRHSGDLAFLTDSRDAIEKAWAFETNPAEDTDHDGIYDNSQGTGWVESWPGGMPHQEIYLALLDQQASSAYAYIEDQLHDSAKAQSARARATKIAATINSEYYDPQKGCYAFATDPAGLPVVGLPPGETSPNSPIDRTTTIYPALAWWDPGESNSAGAAMGAGKSTGMGSILDKPDPCLRNFISSALNTDWGTRDIANNEKDYDGMSYHQGSVWPLFTGWASLAEYRGNQPLAGYQLLKENANLTWAQDLGAVTELLSGDFFVPFGRSTSHQLWSSAMVITPTLRGLFGITIDAPSKTITVNPHLPGDWDHATINNLALGDKHAVLFFQQQNGRLSISLSGVDESWQLRSDERGVTKDEFDHQQIHIPLSTIEVEKLDGTKPPLPGARPINFRVVNEAHGDHSLTLTLEGPPESEGGILFNEWASKNMRPKITISPPQGSAVSEMIDVADYTHKGGSVGLLPIHFPPGTGWQTIIVTLTW